MQTLEIRVLNIQHLTYLATSEHTLEIRVLDIHLTYLATSEQTLEIRVLDIHLTYLATSEQTLEIRGLITPIHGIAGS